jgi:hypothetical protein
MKKETPTDFNQDERLIYLEEEVMALRKALKGTQLQVMKMEQRFDALEKKVQQNVQDNEDGSPWESKGLL